MNSKWRLLAVVVLLSATVLALVHWHQDLDSQRCEMCRVQQTSILYSPVQNPLSAPVVQGNRPRVVLAVTELDTFIATSLGRSPPVVFFV